MKVFLVFTLLIGLISVTAPVQAAKPEPEGPKLCESTQEYIKTIKFLREYKGKLPEKASRKIASKVSQGCTGASDRFSKIFLLIREMGVDQGQSLDIAMDFSHLDDETFKNFYEIFQRAYLTEFFDFDFKTSFNLAYELSKDYKGNPEQARKDFLALIKFCSEEKKLGLPLRFCAEFATKVAKLSQYYPKGIYQPFEDLYKKLRTKEPFGLSVKKSFELLIQILQHGPKAPDNFIKGYQFALDPKGLDLNANKALKFALKMAQQSVTELPPPLAKKKSN